MFLDYRSYFREQTIATLRANTTFGPKVLDATIAERSAVSQSAQANKSVFDMSDDNAIKEFTAFGAELRKLIGA